jgi:pumilio RNA-binding family
MSKDRYANYVVQRILDVAHPDQLSTIVSLLLNVIPSLRKYTYGKHVATRLEKLSVALGIAPASHFAAMYANGN